jgi:hypothetical protein
MALAFVLVPFVFAVEEMIAEVAILVRADIWLKISKHVLSDME